MALEAIAAPLTDYFPEAPFYIPATGPAARPRRTLKHDDTFVVVDIHGDIGSSPGGSDGLFHADTRFISRLELLINGMQPLLLGCNVRDDNTSLSVDLTNQDIYFDGHLKLPKDTLHIVRTIFLWRDTAYQRLAVQSHADRPVECRLTIAFDSDFADLFEVRGLRRLRRGTLGRRVLSPGAAVLTYDGLDGRLRKTALTFDPAPKELTTTAATYNMVLRPKEARPIFLSVGCGDPEPPAPVRYLRGLMAVHRDLRAGARHAATVATSNEVFNEILCR